MFERDTLTGVLRRGNFNISKYLPQVLGGGVDTPLHLQKRRAAMLNLIMQVRELIAKFSYKQREEFFAETRCFYCETVLLPGERHSFCDAQSSIETDHQCVICGGDERLGDHTECQETIKKFLGFSN